MIDKIYRDFDVIIFSVEKDHLSKQDNFERTRMFEESMKRKDIPYNKAIGSYKGILDNSFIVSDKWFENNLRDIVFHNYNQDTVLYLKQDNTAYIEYADRFNKKIGTLKKTSIVNAINNYDSFTIKGRFAYVVR